jgi:hypothetical protein
VPEKVSVLATPFVYWNRLERADFNNVLTVTFKMGIEPV